MNSTHPFHMGAAMAPVQIDPTVSSRLLRNRIVMLGTQVDDDIANSLVSQLLLLTAEDPDKEITMFINSPGGSVSAGMAIYDTMQYISCPVRTIAMGLAASMGQFLLTAGAPGQRLVMPHTRVMMHQPLGGIGGTASDIRIQAEQMKYTKHLLANLIAKHSGQPLERVQVDSDRDNWFSAEAAVEYGLADAIVTPLQAKGFSQ